MKTDIKKMPKSQMEISFELTEEEFRARYNHTFSHLKERVKIDGFRQGNAPDKMVEERVGKENLLMEAGDHAVKHVYSDFILESKLKPIGEPEISIVKILLGSEFIFKAKISVLPEINLPEYKEIAKKILTEANKEEISVDEKEVEDTINYLAKTKAKIFQQDKLAETGDFAEIEYQSPELENNKLFKDGFILGNAGMVKGFEETILGMKAGQEKETKIKFPADAVMKNLANREIIFKIKVFSVKKVDLPEINNEFAKQLGAFDGLVALRENIKQGIKTEKQDVKKQKNRDEILEKISEKISAEIPEKLLEGEKQDLFENLKNNVAENLKIKFEEYLATIKKTEEEIKNSFEKEAEKRLKKFLVLRQIGKKENINVSEQELEQELKRELSHYKKEDLAGLDTERLKEYIKGVIFNEKVFQILETFSQK